MEARDLGVINGVQSYLVESNRNGSAIDRDAPDDNNGRWSSETNLEMKRGDRVSVECVAIESTGASNSGATIEFTGKPINRGHTKENFTDDQCVLEFNFYIQNNGHNSCNLPIHFNNEIAIEYLDTGSVKQEVGLTGFFPFGASNNVPPLPAPINPVNTFPGGESSNSFTAYQQQVNKGYYGGISNTWGVSNGGGGGIGPLGDAKLTPATPLQDPLINSPADYQFPGCGYTSQAGYNFNTLVGGNKIISAYNLFDIRYNGVSVALPAPIGSLYNEIVLCQPADPGAGGIGDNLSVVYDPITVPIKEDYDFGGKNLPFGQGMVVAFADNTAPVAYPAVQQASDMSQPIISVKPDTVNYVDGRTRAVIRVYDTFSTAILSQNDQVISIIYRYVGAGEVPKTYGGYSQKPSILPVDFGSKNDYYKQGRMGIGLYNQSAQNQIDLAYTPNLAPPPPVNPSGYIAGHGGVPTEIDQAKRWCHMRGGSLLWEQARDYTAWGTALNFQVPQEGVNRTGSVDPNGRPTPGINSGQGLLPKTCDMRNFKDNAPYILTRPDFMGPQPHPNGLGLCPKLEPLSCFVHVKAGSAFEDVTALAAIFTEAFHAINKLLTSTGSDIQKYINESEYPFNKKSQIFPLFTEGWFSADASAQSFSTDSTVAVPGEGYSSLNQPVLFKGVAKWNKSAPMWLGNCVKCIPANLDVGTDWKYQEGSPYFYWLNDLKDYLKSGANNDWLWNNQIYGNMGLKDMNNCVAGDYLARLEVWDGNTAIHPHRDMARSVILNIQLQKQRVATVNQGWKNSVLAAPYYGRPDNHWEAANFQFWGTELKVGDVIFTNTLYENTGWENMDGAGEFEEAWVESVPTLDLIVQHEEVLPSIVSTPQPDLIEEFPEVPGYTIFSEIGADPEVPLTWTYTLGHVNPAIVLNPGMYMKFTDSGGLPLDYINGENRNIIFDAGPNNHIWIRVNSLNLEHTIGQRYDRLGITADNNYGVINTTTSPNLNNVLAPTLSQNLYTSTISVVGANVWGSGNGGYNTGVPGGGYIFPSSSGIDVDGNNNANWTGQWHQVLTRYVRFHFLSDGSVVRPGWDIDILASTYVPAVPAYTVVTPQPDIITTIPGIPAWEEAIPQPDTLIHHDAAMSDVAYHPDATPEEIAAIRLVRYKNLDDIQKAMRMNEKYMIENNPYVTNGRANQEAQPWWVYGMDVGMSDCSQRLNSNQIGAGQPYLRPVGNGTGTAADGRMGIMTPIQTNWTQDYPASADAAPLPIVSKPYYAGVDVVTTAPLQTDTQPQPPIALQTQFDLPKGSTFITPSQSIAGTGVEIDYQQATEQGRVEVFSKWNPVWEVPVLEQAASGTTAPWQHNYAPYNRHEGGVPTPGSCRITAPNPPYPWIYDYTESKLRDIGAFPYLYTDEDGVAHKFIAWVVSKEHSAVSAGIDEAVSIDYVNATSTWTLGDITWGDFFGFSPAFGYDQPALIPTNNDVISNQNVVTWSDGITNVGNVNPNTSHKPNNINHVWVGANNASMTFDQNKNRFELGGLYTSNTLNSVNAQSSAPAVGAIPNSQIGEQVATINSNDNDTIMLGNQNNPIGTKQNAGQGPHQSQDVPGVYNWNPRNQGVQDSISGICLANIYHCPQNWTPPAQLNPQNLTSPYMSNAGGNEDPYSPNVNLVQEFRNETEVNYKTFKDTLTLANADNWDGTILHKMGFDYDQLIPYVGSQNNRYSQWTYGKSDITIQEQGVKPLILNAELDTSATLDLNTYHQRIPALTSIATGSIPTTLGPFPTYGQVWTEGTALYRTGTLNNKTINLDASVGAVLTARNQPSLYACPYYIIMTDLVSTTFQKGKMAQNAIYYGLKSYSAGQYFYVYASGYTQLVQADRLVQSITTELRNPLTGEIARVGKNSSIIYKIDRDISLPPITMLADGEPVHIPDAIAQGTEEDKQMISEMEKMFVQEKQTNESLISIKDYIGQEKAVAKTTTHEQIHEERKIEQQIVRNRISIHQDLETKGATNEHHSTNWRTRQSRREPLREVGELLETKGEESKEEGELLETKGETQLEADTIASVRKVVGRDAAQLVADTMMSDFEARVRGVLARRETRADLMKDKPEEQGDLSMASEPERARVAIKGGKGDSGGSSGGGDARRIQLERDREIKAQQDRDYQASLDKDKAKDDAKETGPEFQARVRTEEAKAKERADKLRDRNKK